MRYTEFVAIFILGFFLNIFCSHIEIQQKSDESGENTLDDNTFPKHFLFGVSISAPQHEGAWNVSDKGQSVWDYMSHVNPKTIADESNMDIASDFYHKYKEDLRLAKNIGAQIFRLSLSWTRLLPKGFTNYISKDGIKFYNNVLDEILKNGMIPMVTLFQMDLPNDMQKMGGLTNPLFVDWFEQYARFAFATFGDKVKLWTTISEPNTICFGGYSYEFIPTLNLSGIGDYLCGHHAVLAHARAYRLYDREFRSSQKGKVGYAINFQMPEPADPTSPEDAIVVEKFYQLSINGQLRPIFSSDGDYSPMIKELIANHSRIQGFAKSRLPSFTKQQMREVSGSADFLGVTYYTYDIIGAQNTDGPNVPLYDKDVGSTNPTSYLVKNTPQVLGKVLERLHKDYRPTIYIIENGFPDVPLKDKAKVKYLQGHLAEVLKQIKNDVDIRAYLIWSLLDGFQWQFGYRLKYGLFQVDFNDPNLRRTPRLSARYIAHVYKTRRLEDTLDIDNLPRLNTSV